MHTKMEAIVMVFFCEKSRRLLPKKLIGRTTAYDEMHALTRVDVNTPIHQLFSGVVKETQQAPSPRSWVTINVGTQRRSSIKKQ